MKCGKYAELDYQIKRCLRFYLIYSEGRLVTGVFVPLGNANSNKQGRLAWLLCGCFVRWLLRSAGCLHKAVVRRQTRNEGGAVFGCATIALLPTVEFLVVRFFVLFVGVFAVADDIGAARLFTVVSSILTTTRRSTEWSSAVLCGTCCINRTVFVRVP